MSDHSAGEFIAGSSISVRDSDVEDHIPLPSRHHLSYDDCLEVKRKNNRTVLCSVELQLCSMIRVHV